MANEEMLTRKEGPKSEIPALKTKILPTRGAKEMHGPLDTLLRVSQHTRLTSETARTGNAKAVAKADLDMTIARNLSELRLERSLPQRFQGLLEKMG